MKYVNMTTVLLSLIGMFIVLMLGIQYYTVGYGLHPAFAAVLFITLFAGGFAAATLIKE